MKSPNLLEESENIFDYIFNVSQDIPAEYINLDTNSNFGQPMVDDLGDCLPFVAWLGRIKSTKNNAYSIWSIKKANQIINTYQTATGFLVTSKSFFTTFDADKLSDTILGINLLYKITGEPFLLRSSENFFRALEKMMSKEGYVYYKVIPALHQKLPITSGKFCGLYIEEATILYEITKNKKYLRLAEQLARPWLSTSFFNRYGLFNFQATNTLGRPLINGIFKIKTSFDLDTVMLTKSNTNLVLGITRLNDMLKSNEITSALLRWAEALEKHLLTKENIALSLWSPKRYWKVHYLGSNHAALEALLDIYVQTNKKSALHLAERLAKAWLRHQSEMGLIPEILFPYSTKNLPKEMKNYAMTCKHVARLDSQTDFAVVLFKLAELTKNKAYFNSAEQILQGILKYHKYKQGFCEFVELETMKQMGRVIETKFLFLVTKLFLVANQIEEGSQIFKKTLIKDIVRDR